MKNKRVVVVTHHHHYESGDVIAVFKFYKKAKQYVEDLIKNNDKYEFKEYDDGSYCYSSELDSYEIKRFLIE